MSARCSNGHTSTSTDYCDTCGAPIGDGTSAGSAAPASSAAAQAGSSAVSGSAVPAVPATRACPHCGVDSPADALFCESCGYDFTTGALPRPLTPPDAGSADAGPPDAPAPLAPAVELEWVAELWVDPDWYAEQDSPEQCPSPGLPVVVPLTVRSVLVGRLSRSRNIHPQVDCDGDVGVSRRQAQLTTDGSRWWVEDLQSANGTYVGAASGPLPVQPLTPGQRHELAEDDRVYVGAWTRIVLRRATAQERQAAHGGA